MNYKVYVDPKKIGKNHFSALQNAFPHFEFIADKEDSYQADIIIDYPAIATKKQLEQYPNLKWIQFLTAGYNNVDLDYLRERNILVSNAKGVYSITIAEDVITKILVLNRLVSKYVMNMKQQVWQSEQKEEEIYQSTVGILGAGSIATEIAKRLRPFEVSVLGYRKNEIHAEFFDQIYVGRTGLEQLLKQSDIVIVALPLNEETKLLFGTKEFSLMKTNALFINIGRGEIVNQEALIQALQTKQIRGAALDVTSPEPLPVNSPLWTMEQVFITPHNAAYSTKMLSRLAAFLKLNLALFDQHKKIQNKI